MIPPTEASDPGPINAESSLAPEDACPRYGDSLLTIRDASAVHRTILLNIGGFPHESHPKMKELLKMTQQHTASMLLLPETNQNWSVIPTNHRPSQVLKRIYGPDSRVAVTHNVHGIHTKWQYGSCLTLTLGQDMSRASEEGRDPTGLGRWAWQSHRRTQGCQIKFYTAYCPIQTTNLGSIYTQHLAYFVHQNESQKSPRQRFVLDLSQSISNNLDKGIEVILGLDANFDLKAVNNFTTAMANLNLRNPFLALIGKGHGPLPPTRCPGSWTIDGIFVSPGIQVQACGILGATDEPTMTDHAALWMDFSPKQLHGTKLPLFIRPDARRLQLNCPSVVTKFQATVFKVASSQKIHS